MYSKNQHLMYLGLVKQIRNPEQKNPFELAKSRFWLVHSEM